MDNIEAKLKMMMLKLKIILAIVALFLVCLFIISVVMMIIGASADMSGTCWLRYTKDSTTGALTNSVMSTQKSVSLKANANYKTQQVRGSDPSQIFIQPDPSSYGTWLDAGELINGDGFEIEVNGSISLCKSYVTKNNLQQTNAPDSALEIPRVGSTTYLPMTFAANTGEWRNVAEVMANDKVRILAGPPVTASNAMDVKKFTIANGLKPGTNISPVVDCSSNVTTNVSPMCGRMSIYKGQYVKGCIQRDISVPYTCTQGECWGPNYDTHFVWHNTYVTCEFNSKFIQGLCPLNKGSVIYKTYPESDARTQLKKAGLDPSLIDSYINSNLAYKPVYANMPSEYSPNLSFFYNEFDSNSEAPTKLFSDYLQNMNIDCSKSKDRDAVGPQVSLYKFWMINGDGLLYRFTDSVNDISAVQFSHDTTMLRSKGFPDSTDGNVPPGYILYNDIVMSSNVPSGATAALQLGYTYNNTSADNTGGYVLYIQHTKCVRNNGQYADDVISGRGKILYYVLPMQYDMNNMPSDTDPDQFQHGFLDLTNSNKYFLNIDSGQQMRYGKQRLWLKISNKQEDYKDSDSQYEVKFNKKLTVGLFSAKVLMPFFSKIDSLLTGIGDRTYKNLTCYGGDSGKCTDFFLYIRALLTLYLSMFGFSFLMGRTRLNQKEFISHVVKILIIAGLINGSTFTYFSNYIYPITMNFTNAIMSNFGGYSGNNPLEFLDDALNAILFNTTTLFQLLSLISFGLPGILFFIATGIGIAIFLATAFQVIATYLIAKLFLGVLLGLAPFFLVFMLFSATRSFFQSWVNAVFRYMIEPAVVTLGVAVFAKVYMLYLDKALGYSVCFKCAIPFKIPSIFMIQGLPDSFKNIYIFCFNWFGAWGMDTRYGLMGISPADIIGLVLVAFMMMTYTQFASSIVSSLSTSMGPSAAASGSEAGMLMAKTAANFTILAPLNIRKGYKYAKRKIKDTKEFFQGNNSGGGGSGSDSGSGSGGSSPGGDSGGASGGSAGGGDSVGRK